VRGGRSLRELDRIAAAAHGLSLPAVQAQSRAPRTQGDKLEPLIEEKEEEDAEEEEGDETPPPPALVFLAVSVDASPHMAQAHGPATWPHLRHYWIDAHAIAELGTYFRILFELRVTHCQFS